jgi:hypothetical protein
MNHDALHLRVQVGSEQVRRALESRMPELIDALRDHDLRVAQADVTLRGSEPSARQSGTDRGDVGSRHGSEERFEQPAGRQHHSEGRPDLPRDSQPGEPNSDFGRRAAQGDDTPSVHGASTSSAASSAEAAAATASLRSTLDLVV